MTTVRSVKLVAVLAAAAVLSACATSQPAWHKRGVTQQDTESALAECHYKVAMNKIAEKQQGQLVEDCMRGQGFRWQRD